MKNMARMNAVVARIAWGKLSGVEFLKCIVDLRLLKSLPLVRGASLTT